MHYVILVVALILEVIGTSFLKYSHGFERPLIGCAAYGLYAVSIYMFGLAIKTINLAVADTIWQGTGIVLITMVSYLVFHEPLTPPNCVHDNNNDRGYWSRTLLM